MSSQQPTGRLRPSRRRALRLLGASATLATLPGSASATAADDDGHDVVAEHPGVAWARTYDGVDGPMTLRNVVTMPDGGYALAGDAVPEAGSATETFVVVRVAADGTERWRTFVDDGVPETTQEARDLIRTADDGLVVAGYGQYPDEPTDYRTGTRLAEAARLDPDGGVAWFRRFDAYETDDRDDDEPDPGLQDSAMAFGAAPRGDGGAVVAGVRNDAPWAVALTAGGDVDWELSDPRRQWFQSAFRTDAGHVLIGTPADEVPYHAVHVDDGGEVVRTDDLQVDRQQVPDNHTFLPIGDGGYAYTGRNTFWRDVVLGRLDAAGQPIWTRTYDGPAGDTDLGRALAPTSDGGFVVAGFATVERGGPGRPALFRTTADGELDWRVVMSGRPEIVGDTGFGEIVATGDGGFAAVATPHLVRFAPGSGGGTPSPGGGGGGTSTPTDDDGTPGGGTPGGTPTEGRGPRTTATDGPGLGAPAALAGLIGGAAAALRRAGFGGAESDDSVTSETSDTEG